MANTKLNSFGAALFASSATGVKVAVGASVPSGVSVGGRNVAVMTIGKGVNGGNGLSGVLGLVVIMPISAMSAIVPNRNKTVNRFAMMCLLPDAAVVPSVVVEADLVTEF